MTEFVELLYSPWIFLAVGYLVTIAIETPILCLGLSSEHPLSRRMLAGLWLTACTYPIVVLVVPHGYDPGEHYGAYLLLAESIAHFGECLLFYLAFAPRQHPWRDVVVVFLANLASFALGMLLYF